ncbi:hypothetical protein F511_39250 [Dorcoceras hygrometricum]|uniref:Uncharacterized protein n=1 Tax=Dorcoceras hygrometricum TaxID=472368 RepID=A0A2Z7CWN8_9LAMI|nr:hypothetical protein F511_39250 [Dorcoceras hygrometricum]
MSSYFLDLSIETVLEPCVGVLRECEVVAVFVLFCDFRPVVLLSLAALSVTVLDFSDIGSRLNELRYEWIC